MKYTGLGTIHIILYVPIPRIPGEDSTTACTPACNFVIFFEFILFIIQVSLVVLRPPLIKENIKEIQV